MKKLLKVHTWQLVKFLSTAALNVLKPNGYFTYHQVQHSQILRGVHIAFVCYVRISADTATFAW